MVKKPIKVGYFGYDTSSWMGGVNYLKNHLIALKKVDDYTTIKPFIFFKEKHDTDIKKIFEPLATCIVLKTKRPIPFFFKILDKLTGKKKLYFYRFYLRKFNINLIAQSDIETNKLNYKSIGWIPDFQHIHLPQLFSKNELLERDNKYKTLISSSDLMIVSSYDCLKDIETFYPNSSIKSRVLHFVAQIENNLLDQNNTLFSEILSKYHIPSKYFFLPNKFYRHKNHKIVFEAINILKQEGIEVTLVCTGEFNAYESEDHIDELDRYLNNNALKHNIRILGIINYSEVQELLKRSISVINPSLFEGWSTSVEECKSTGKHIILSNIPVHIEQAPKNSIYFDPNNSNTLALILKKRWLSNDIAEETLDKDQILSELEKRTIDFGLNYSAIINEAANG
jgi:glycosyltransferase involved in cell wall biosynthesis